MDSQNNEMAPLRQEVVGLKTALAHSHREYRELSERTTKSLEELYHSSNDLIIILGGDHKLQFINQACRFKLGYSEKQIQSLQLSDIIHSEYHSQLFTNLDKLISNPGTVRINTVFQSNQGKKIYVNGQITSFFVNDLPIEIRCVFYDISERVRAESAQSLYYSIANLSHYGYAPIQLFQQIFTELSKHLKIRNFSTAIRTDESGFEFPFRINEYDQAAIRTDELLANYTLERGKPLIVYKEGIRKITKQFHSTLDKHVPEIWLGVPLHSGPHLSGVMMMSSYDDQVSYNHKDLELLDFISSQVSLALELNKSREKIQGQDARLKAIFESSTHQIWSIDRAYNFTSYNENFKKSTIAYFGVSPSIGMRIDQLLPSGYDDERKQRWLGYYKQAFQGQVINFQTHFTTSHSQTAWLDVFLNPIFLPDGKIDEISIIANDITEKKNAEKALIESEEKFRNIFESFQDIYFRCDINGKILMISPSVKEVLGIEPKNVLTKNISEYFLSEGNTANLIKKLYQNHQVRNFEGLVKTPEGKTLTFLCNIRLLRQPNLGTVEIEGVARDITQLKEASNALQGAKELAERSLKIKERFLANMSHEIRTPMNGIVGMIDLMGSTRLNKEQSEYIRTMKKSSETLLNILNDILDLSKIEAGKMELRNEPCKLIEIFEKIYELFSQQAHLNKTNLYYHLDEQLPDYVMIDETRLVQIISNLISNAIKFSQKRGTINVGIRLINETDDYYEFRVAVKDSGIGIHPKDQEKLFKIFSQLDSSKRKLFAGTGLGLAISKELVKSMNGEIGVVSTPGLGSTFWFTFQAGKVTEIPVKEKTEEFPLKKEFILRQPRVLLVDDNEINRKVASQILAKSGCQVISAFSGKQAIDLISKQRFDLVFMDIQMPEMDGIETTKKIRELELEYVPPIIAMTAYSMEEDRERFLRQGMDDYLAKPIKSNLIIDKVKQYTRFEPREVDTKVFEEQAEALIINQNTLNQLYKYGGKELIVNVLHEFNNEAIQQVKQSLRFYNKKEFEKMQRELHTLKGNAGTLGIERLSKQAAVVEKKIKENNFDKLKPDLSKLKKSLKEFQDSYKNIIKDE